MTTKDTYMCIHNCFNNNLMCVCVCDMTWPQLNLLTVRAFRKDLLAHLDLKGYGGKRDRKVRKI